MTASLILHVGSPRSGSRHLQSVLAAGRRELATAGILYPGEGYLPRGGLNQQAVGHALAGPEHGRPGDGGHEDAVRHLARIRSEVAAHDGRTLLSGDSLSRLDLPAANRLLDLLDADPAAVTVVVTARDLGRLVPAWWQGTVEDGSAELYEPYLRALLARRAGAGGPAGPPVAPGGDGSPSDLPALVDRWSRLVGADRVTLVTVPADDAEPHRLWTRFAVATGLPVSPPGSLPASPAAWDDDVPLSAVQVQLLRTVNALLLDSGQSARARQVLRARLLDIWHGLGVPPVPRLTVPGELRPAVRAWADDDVARLRASGVRVAGSLGELTPCFGPLPGTAVLPVEEALGHDVLALLTHDPSAIPGPGRLVRLVRRLSRPRPAARPATRPAGPAAEPAPPGRPSRHPRGGPPAGEAPGTGPAHPGTVHPGTTHTGTTHTGTADTDAPARSAERAPVVLLPEEPTQVPVPRIGAPLVRTLPQEDADLP